MGPATGNLMYMMPQKGSRVSLYFKGDEETDAIAVNCIRSGEGCAGADYRDKSLVTEQGMELRLHQGDMGVVSLKEKVLLDDLEGIRIGGSGGLHILAAGEVKIDGAEVRVEGTEGVYLYEGEAKADEEGTVSVTVKGKVELSADEEGSAVHSRGENVTYYLAWEHMDLSHPSNRYRDEPEQKDYDWAKWRMNIVSGVAVAAVAAGAAALVAGGAGFLAGAGAAAGGGAASGTAGVAATGAAAGAAKATGMAVFLTGSLYVAEQAVSDAMSGRLSETEQYARKALAGSVVGFLTGASGLLMQGAGLGKVLALGFGEGFLGSAATQALLNEDGEINWALAFGEGMFSAAVTGMAWKIGGNVKGFGEGNDVLESASNANLIGELANSGVKYNPEDIVAIIKTADGKLVWLEKGNSRAGLEHIMQHADQFATKGISIEKIPDFIMHAIANGKVVGTQRTRTIYEVMYEGRLQRVAISIGDNGFIVGANPKSIP